MPRETYESGYSDDSVILSKVGALLELGESFAVYGHTIPRRVSPQGRRDTYVEVVWGEDLHTDPTDLWHPSTATESTPAFTTPGVASGRVEEATDLPVPTLADAARLAVPPSAT